MRTHHVSFVMQAILLACTAAPVAAQTFTGGISGTIRDSAGGVIPQVEVRLRNLETNDLRVQSTNEQGYYSFVAVPPGRYRLEAERTGFSRFVREPIELRVQQFVSLDAVLAVGETAQSVEVSSAVALLDPNTSSLGQVVENRQITELPLNGRNTLAFVELTPGIRIQGAMGENPATVNYMGWGNFSSNGGLANANEVLVDGAPVTSGGLNSVGYVPPVDATQEFRVQTNAYSAEFGRSAGAIVNLSIKSGTNRYHGSAYEFFRNNVLDANDFFLNRAGRPRPALQYNQFGFSSGGPIVKNRTFVFGNYEAFRQRQGIALTTTVPTVLERSGDFSQTFNASGQMVIIADPRTTRPGPDGTLIRSPFPNNRIPLSQMDPVAERLRNLVWALPTNPGRGPSGVDNFAASSKQATNTDQFVTRLDHQFSGAWRMYGTYAYQFYDLGAWDIFGNKTTTADFGRAEKNRIHNVVLSATGVLRPNLVAELRASYNRLSSNRTPPSTGFDLTSIGWPRSLVDQFQFRTFPTIQVAGVQSLDASTSSTIQRANGAFSESASLTWIRGKHNLKFGFQHRLWQIRDAQNNVGTPTLTFNPRFTSLDPLRVTPGSGVGMASFLLGMGSGGTVAIVQPLAEQRWYWSFFVQDDWKVTSKLTLNVGLQYSLDSPLNERYDRLAWFDPAAVPPIAQTVGLPLSGALRFVDRDNRYPQELFTKQWAPRIGFAYQWRPRTVFRGGYGVFWLPNNLLTTNSASGVAPMVSVSTPWVTSLDNGITPADLLANPFPNGLLQPPGKKDGLNTLIGQNMASIGFRNDRPGYMQQWNFNIQQELWTNFAIDIAYAGSKGTALPAARPLNELPSQYLSLGNRLNEQVENPFFGRVSTGPLAQRTVSRGQLLRPFPHFNNITHWGSPSGSSSYHSMQLKVTKRFSSSLLGVAYTISKGIGDVESWSGAWLEQNVIGIGNFLYMTDYNRRLDRSINLFDVPQRFVVSYTLEAPLGRGKTLLNNLGKADLLVSGWEVSGIYTLQSGTPLLFFTASNLTNTFQGGSRPNNNGTSAKLDGDAHSRLNRWFDTSVFSQPPAFTFGNASRTSPDVRNHHTNNLDAAFLKNNRFGAEGRFNLQFRAEFFNLFNRVRFGNPGVTQGTPQFGVISSQINRPRLVQFALKFLF